MSKSWQDLLDEMGPPGAGTDTSDTTAPVEFDPPVEIVGPPADLRTFHPDGPEPPPHLVRFEEMQPGLHLARCVAGGYWWVPPTSRNPLGPGWAWEDRPANRMAKTLVHPVFPEVANMPEFSRNHFLNRLASALPANGDWYRIATWDGVPVWGRRTTGGNTGLRRTPTHPEGDSS